jgi:hypothetical protein
MRITSFGLIFRILLGSFGYVILEVVLLKNLHHLINLFLHACRLKMITMVGVTTFGIPFLSFSTFRARGIIKQFGVPFLLWICMHLSLAFFLGLWIACTSSLMHKNCMCIGSLDYPHLDELLFITREGFNKMI